MCGPRIALYKGMKYLALSLLLQIVMLMQGAGALAVETKQAEAEAVAVRLSHARELLGRHYRKSVVKITEKIQNEQAVLQKALKTRAKGKLAKKVGLLTETLIAESHKHDFDPFFVMAVIEGESSFNNDARGPFGEIGLMQIRLETGKWLAKKINMTWEGEKTLKDPVKNIRLGTLFLSLLRERFDGHGRLYISAYNMGARNVDKSLSKKIWPKDYAQHVMKRYVAAYREIAALPEMSTKAVSRGIASVTVFRNKDQNI